MPNIKSAIKRVKVTEKKTLNNNMIKSETKTAIRKYEEANAKGDKSAVELLKGAKKLIDHAATKGVISENAASRKKSRLEKKLAVKAEVKKAPTKKAEVKKEEPKAEVSKEDKKETSKLKKSEATEKTATKKTTAKKETKKAE